VVSLDLRTRTDADIRSVATPTFFEIELPALIEQRADLALPGARELGVEPLAVETPSGTWTLALDGNGLTVTRGDTGSACVALSDDDVADLVNDLKTPMTFVTAGALQMARGNLGDLLDWWVVLRALVDGRRAHTAGSIELRDRSGAPLDLHRSFTPGDDDAEIAHFLAEAGFVHLRGWFDPETMQRVSVDMDDALPSYRRDDGRSWWAKTADGADRCVRMQFFHEHSPATAELLEGHELTRIGGLADDGYVPRRIGNRIEALVKPIGVVEGISDVPWHKDCSLGMHSYNCCSLTVGISVTGADDRSGQLRVVAGSHRALVQPAFVRPEWALPVVDLPTAAGDATVHCSCTLHTAQPPVDRERKVMYTGFGLPPLAPAGEARTQAVASISAVREASYKNVSQPPARTA
jgi:Phytanoyl-CoA dioxygenase (PhyH)